MTVQNCLRSHCIRLSNCMLIIAYTDVFVKCFMHNPPRSRNSSEVDFLFYVGRQEPLLSTLLSVLGEFLFPLRSDEIVDIVALNDFLVSGYQVGHTHLL